MSKRKQTYDVIREELNSSESENEISTPESSQYAEKMHKLWSDEPSQDLLKRRKNDAIRKAESRKTETEEHSKLRRSLDATNKARTRSNETAEQTSSRRLIDAARKANFRREKKESDLNKFDNILRQTDFEETTIQEHNLGPLSIICNFCMAKHFLAEQPTDKKFTVCCNKGRVRLSPLTTTHNYLKKLMTGEDPDSKHFMQNIRSYNNAFAFASVGANIRLPEGFGPYCFRIHGQIYHRTGTLYPGDKNAPKFSQLYVFDPDEAINNRMNDPSTSSCMKTVMTKLNDIMKDNQFAKAYKMMHEVEQEERERAQFENRQYKEVSMAILQNRNDDIRRYNVQRCNEVAVIFSNVDGEPPLERDLLIHLRPSGQNIPKTQRISILHKNLDALTYPILFPNGEQGWSDDLKLYNPHNHSGNTRNRITLKMYYSYHFSIRDNDNDGFNPILRAGKLTQQYFVDAYVKAEANDLNYIRQHQSDFRVETYQNLIEHIGSEHDRDGVNPGKRVILPSTFQGSPRNMQQNYQDAMAIVRKYGKPDYFITMTCNPKWDEILQNLSQGEYAINRPDIVARVFRLKLQSLLKEITVSQVFGEYLAHVHVIEFQKRGLPHAHILLILKTEHKPKTAEMIDRFVKAEIPDPRFHPKLFQIVINNMIHGPCDSPTSCSPCLVDGKCSKGFPKKFQTHTVPEVNGYPLYTRRVNEPILLRKTRVDNRWVVPYNPYLSLRYNCHINVEVCASIKSVKYLFKYVYKGHDCANVLLKSDEIQTHVDSRYVSPPEAAWRIFRFPMHDQSHAVIRLAVHLPNDPLVAFQPNDIPLAISRTYNRNTTLTAWFKLNQVDFNARQYKYHEIPEHYVFNTGSCMWNKRKRGHEKIIGRIHSVSIKDTERYFLRLLLLHEKGAQGFDDLLTYENQVYNTFYDAAKARHLISSEEVWNDTLLDACSLSMPMQLRDLFAYICVFANLSDATNLWDNHKESMIEDFARRHKHPAASVCDICEAFALRHIQETLSTHGKTCGDFHLREPSESLTNNTIDYEEIQREHFESKKLYSTLNKEQRESFDTVMQAIESEKSNSYFLDGPGGSGKTYLYRTLLAQLRGQGKVALAVASTGIAANLLKGGRTYHSQFKIPLNLNETSVSGIKMTSNDAALIRKSQLIIWDESTMAPALALECVDRLLREIMQNEYPFGGKVILLGGDFRQCLPVLPHADAVAIVQASIKFSDLWSQFKHLHLKTNVRSIDPEYSEWLMKLGNGELTNEDGLDENLIVIPESMLASEDIVKDIFGDSLTPENVDSFSKVAILSPKNEDVDKINERVLELLEGQTFTYISSDSLTSDDENESNDYPVEFLNSLNLPGLAPHKLNLKVGSLIMLLRNLNTNRGLCNGTRLVVTEIKTNLVIAKVLTGSAEGQVVFIPRIDMTTESSLPFELKRRQFPVKLAFCMTINKSQGQTLEKVGIYLPNPVFSHGQLYVAFSRVRRSCDVKVHVSDTPEQGKLIKNSQKVFTRNVVHKDILSR